MKNLLLIISLASFQCGPKQAVSNDWEYDYSRTCTFNEEAAVDNIMPCDQYYRITKHIAKNGLVVSHFDYMWRSKNGREVKYSSQVGVFGVGNFTIGILEDNKYAGGIKFDPAVSYAPHRECYIIGVPNEGYDFKVCNSD